MSAVLALLLTLRTCARSRAVLQLEVLALRHQLQVLQRSRPRRLRLAQADRLLWVWLARVWNEWRTTLVIVKPETVIAWHRRAFRAFWSWKSRRRVGRTSLPPEVRALIRRMSDADPRWGAPRIPRRIAETRHGREPVHGREIHGRLDSRRRRLGVRSSESRRTDHGGGLLWCRPRRAVLFVLVILAHARRRIVHVAVTEQPTAAWTGQQLREAFPWEQAPRYLVRDRDHAFAAWANTATTMGIEEVLTAPRSPWQNAYVERFIGSVRRECLDHVMVLSATGLNGDAVYARIRTGRNHCR